MSRKHSLIKRKSKRKNCNLETNKTEKQKTSQIEKSDEKKEDEQYFRSISI